MLAKGATCLSVSGVYFTCPLTGATLTKSEREARVKEAILMVRPKAAGLFILRIVWKQLCGLMIHGLLFPPAV